MEFLRTHSDVLAGAHFFTVEMRTALSLIHYHAFFVIRLATREACIAGNSSATINASAARAGMKGRRPLQTSTLMAPIVFFRVSVFFALPTMAQAGSDRTGGPGCRLDL
jgi:hypothetical protein